MINTSRFASIVTGLLGTILLSLAWRGLEDRPPLHQGKPDFRNVYSQLSSTVKKLRTENTHLFQYLVGVVFLDAANGNMYGILPVYAMQQIKIDNPAAIGAVTVLFCIPGALITKR